MESETLKRIGRGTANLLLLLAPCAVFTNMQMRADCRQSSPAEITLRPAVAVRTAEGGIVVGFDVVASSAATIRSFSAEIVAFGRDGRRLGEFLLSGGPIFPGVLNAAELTLDVDAADIGSLQASLVSLQDDCGRDARDYSIKVVK